jgi:uncharacterized protein YbaP (TraB family)
MFLTRLFATLALALALTPAAAQETTCAGQDLIAALAPGDRAALDEATAAVPYPQGLRWRATGGGRTIDILGTFHLYDPRMPIHVARLLPAIRAADRVWLEATTAEMAELQHAISTRPDLILTRGATLPERLSEPEWQTLSAALTERGIPAFMASKFQPWYISVLLAMPPCAMAAMAGGSTGIDHLIEEAAQAEGVPAAALEPYDTIFTIFGAIPPDQQLDLIRAALPTAGQAEDMLATMVESYFREDHRQIWEFARLAALRADPAARAQLEKDFALMEEALIARRNRAWAEVLTGGDAGETIVVAVGAGHLSGEDGLLRLLERAGFALERLEF